MFQTSQNYNYRKTHIENHTSNSWDVFRYSSRFSYFSSVFCTKFFPIFKKLFKKATKNNRKSKFWKFFSTFPFHVPFCVHHFLMRKMQLPSKAQIYEFHFFSLNISSFNIINYSSIEIEFSKREKLNWSCQRAFCLLHWVYKRKIFYENFHFSFIFSIFGIFNPLSEILDTREWWWG